MREVSATHPSPRAAIAPPLGLFFTSSSARTLAGSAPAWALAAASSLTSLAAHRLGGGALPSGSQWILPLIAMLAVWVIARPMRLTSRSAGVLLVLGQLLGHVALQLGVPHAMGAPGVLPLHGGGMPMPATGSMAGMTPDAAGGAGMGATPVMIVAHLVGTLCAWSIAHLLLRAAGAGRSRWDALTGRMVLPRIVIRRRRVAVRRERSCAPRARWSTVAPLRGPPTGRLAAL